MGHVVFDDHWPQAPTRSLFRSLVPGIVLLRKTFRRRSMQQFIEHLTYIEDARESTVEGYRLA
jgi:hypothetical protein